MSQRRFYYRRWVRIWCEECEAVDLDDLCDLLESYGAEVVAAVKPGWNTWNHVGFLATPSVRQAIDKKLKSMGMKFRTRRGRGNFRIHSPEKAMVK